MKLVQMGYMIRETSDSNKNKLYTINGFDVMGKARSRQFRGVVIRPLVRRHM